MVLITQIWDTRLGRYVEEELTLCECLPAVVVDGLERRKLIQPTLWDDLAESA